MAVLIGSHDSRGRIILHLSDVSQYRKEDRNVVFVDEFCLQFSRAKNRSSTYGSVDGLLAHLSTCQRLILIQVGGENGFLPNALLKCKSTQATGDYRHQMNRLNYEKWAKEKSVQHLAQNSLIG
jgi:uncharacterized damage-inducible protein DinB